MESVRINLYCAETQKYFKSGGRWTSSPSLAFDFQKFNAAWTAAKCLKGRFDIVVQSGSQKVFVPVDETGRAMASRLMASFDSSASPPLNGSPAVDAEEVLRQKPASS